MSYLDNLIYTFLYVHCARVGGAFGYGPREGAVIYLGIIVFAVFEGAAIAKGSNRR